MRYRHETMMFRCLIFDMRIEDIGAMCRAIATLDVAVPGRLHSIHTNIEVRRASHDGAAACAYAKNAIISARPGAHAIIRMLRRAAACSPPRTGSAHHRSACKMLRPPLRFSVQRFQLDRRDASWSLSRARTSRRCRRLIRCRFHAADMRKLLFAVAYFSGEIVIGRMITARRALAHA